MKMYYFIWSLKYFPPSLSCLSVHITFISDVGRGPSRYLHLNLSPLLLNFSGMLQKKSWPWLHFLSIHTIHFFNHSFIYSFIQLVLSQSLHCKCSWKGTRDLKTKLRLLAKHFWNIKYKTNTHEPMSQPKTYNITFASVPVRVLLP